MEFDRENWQFLEGTGVIVERDVLAERIKYCQRAGHSDTHYFVSMRLPDPPEGEEEYFNMWLLRPEEVDDFMVRHEHEGIEIILSSIHNERGYSTTIYTFQKGAWRNTKYERFTTKEEFYPNRKGEWVRKIPRKELRTVN
jgi:hypothetical protein